MAALLAAMAGLAAPAHAQPLVRKVVTDTLTGVALDGYDAVSYFTGPAPLRGKPDYDFYWGGVPWYFASAANRDVFMRAPEIYAPQFGGHATMSLSRGYLTDGNPQLFVLRHVKLYLFYSAANREAFLMAPDTAVAAAEAGWARLSGIAPITVVAEAPPEQTPPHVPDLVAAETLPAAAIAH